MSLTWPWALSALLIFPALLGYRWWTRRRRRHETVRLPSLALVRAALPGPSRRRRLIPLWLFAAGLVVLAAGAARPRASVPVPANATTIMLAIDSSGSMCSTDVPPNRLTAAQRAAREFVESQPEGADVGLVTFSGTSGLLVEPTDDQQALIAAIDGLRTARGTAIGLAILTSVDAIAEVNADVAPTGVELPPDGPVDVQPDTIVVLTDGRNTQGVDPTTAARQAAARGLRVYTIGFGTTQPAAMVCDPKEAGGDIVFGDGSRFSGFGGRRYQNIDEPTLREVAELTGGEYYEAQDAAELSRVLRDLPSTIVLRRQDMEITGWFALAGALLVLAAVALAQWWGRVPVRSSTSGSPSPR